MYVASGVFEIKNSFSYLGLFLVVSWSRIWSVLTGAVKFRVLCEYFMGKLNYCLLDFSRTFHPLTLMTQRMEGG